MDGNLDAWAKQTLGKTSANNSDNPQAREKILRASQLAKNYDYDIPDDVADEFYELTKHESGRSHYLKDGRTVKTGVRTPDNDFAIGFSQVMGNTAKPYQSKGLDPYKEDDNLIIGLNEFYNGDKQDPVGRRLAYVGGAHSPAYKKYKQTGEISEGKLYSYLPNNKETFGDYVRKSGGLSNLNNWAEQTLSGNEQSPKPQNLQNLDDWANGILGQTDTPQAVGEGAAVSTDLTTGKPVQKGTQPQYQPFEINPTINPPSKISTADLSVQDQSDIANLGTAQVGATNFGASYPAQPKQPETLPSDYVEYLKAREAQDSPDLRNEYSQTLQAAPKDPTAESYQQQVRDTEAQNAAAQQKYQRDLAEYNARYGKQTAELPVKSETKTNAVNAPQTYAPAGSPEESVSTFDVDLSQKPSGMSASDYANKIALQRTGQFSNEEIDSYLRDTPQTTKYDELSDAELKKVGSIPVTVRQGTIDEIIARRPEVQRQKENERQLIDSAKRDDDLYVEAKKQLTDERNDHNLWTTGGLGSYIGDKVGQFVGGEKPEPTQDEVMQRFEQLKQSRLNDEDYQKASNVGDNLNYYLGENLGGFVGSAAGSGGRVFNSLAGMTRPLSSLGVDAPFKEFSKIARYNERIDETSGGDGIISKAFKIAGGLPGDLAQIAVLSRLPGGTVVGFAAHSGLQSAGSGGSFADINKQTLKGAATGALFPVSSVIGKSVAASPAIQTAVKIGTVSVGSTLVELASGTPLEQSVKVGIQNGLFELLPIAKEKLLNKVGRFWSKGKAHDVAIDEQGNVSLIRFKDGANPNRVDFEMVLDPTDGVYKDAAEVGVNRNKQITKGNVWEEFDPMSEGNVPNNDVAAYNRTPAERLNGNQNAPRELAAENPRRIEVAQPEAVQKIAVDTRAQKVIENIKDGRTYTVEQVQKATKYNKSNVEETLLNLYSAKAIEINPDNSFQFIGGENAVTANKSLFERAAEVEAPKESITLPKSSVESEIDRFDPQAGSAIKQPSNENTQQNQALSDVSDINVGESSNEKVDNLSIYEALPQQKQQEAQTEKPKARLDYAEPENLAEKLNVFTERGRKASIAPKVVEQSDLLTSLDEGYPQEFQPRDRSRAASKAQISEIAGRLNPEFLGDSPKASDGRPLVVPVQMPNGQTKYAVISGNGRTAGIREAYNLDNDGAKSYKTFAQSKGGKDLQQPVYVGVMSPNEIDDFSEFAKEANESATAQMSASEMAKSDADRLDASVLNLFVPSEDGSIHGAANRDFVRSFLDKTTSTSERNRYIDANGNLSQDGITKIKNAIFAKAFGNSELGMASIQRMAESTDSNIKNITNALLAKAGELSSFATAAKDNRRFADADIAPDFAKAMEKYSELKDANTSIDEYIRQGALFGADTSPLQTRVMQVFDHYKRRSKSIRGIIDNYIKAAEALGDPNQQGLFGENETPSKESIFEAAVRDYERNDRDEETEQSSLFNENKGRENQPGARQESDATARTPAETTGESGQDRLETQQNEPVLRAAADIKTKTTAERAFINNIKTIAARNFPLDIALMRSKVESKDGVVLLNPYATESFRQILGQIYEDGDHPVFGGGYLKPVHIDLLQNYLENDLPRRSMRPVAAAEAEKLLTAVVESADAAHGDSIILSVSPDFPDGLPQAREEELAHRADARTRGAIDPELILENPAARKAADYLKANLYDDVSEASLAQEVIAKAFRSDAETELSLTDDDLKTIEVDYWKLLSENGITKEQIKAFENVSEKGKEFIRNAEITEIRSRNNGADGRDGQTETLPNDGSRREIRRTGRENRTEFAERKTGFDGIGFDERSRSGNEGLAKAARLDLVKSQNLYKEVGLAPLYARVTPSQKNTLATIFAPIWKGNRETPVTEIITNFRRAGLLTGITTHLKNMSSNTLMQASEEATRPLAVLADLAASAVTGRRTVQNVASLSLVKSFAALIRQDATLTSLNKESGIARAWNILKNGDVSELSKNQLNEMRSGSPILDAMVNYTFRTLGAEDALFKTYAMRRSLEESSRSIAATEYRADKTINFRQRRAELLNSPTNEMLLEAELYSDFTTFTNDNPLSDVFTAIKKSSAAAKFIGETLVPYDKTPTNIIARTLEHTPLGIGWAGKHLYDLHKGDSYTFRRMREARQREQKELDANRKGARRRADLWFNEKIQNAATPAEKARLQQRYTILKNKRNLKDVDRQIERDEIEDAMKELFPRIAQQQFARSFGRTTLGSAGLALGIYLAMNGLLSGVWDGGEKDERDEFFKRRDLGIFNAALQIGGRRYVIGDTPLGKVMAIGASIWERSQQPLKDGQTQTGKTVSDVAEIGWKTAAEQPLLSSLDDYYNPKKTIEQRVGGLLGSFVPTIFADLADVSDDEARDTKSWKSSVMNRVPGLRQYNEEADYPREGYLQDRDNRILRKFDPFSTRPADNAIPRIGENADSSKDKKLDDAVRSGKISTEDAMKQLTDDVNRGDISPSQYKQRAAALSQSKAVKEMSDADANNERDFTAIEKILKNAPEADKPYLEKSLIDKAKAKLNSKTNKGIEDGQKLLEIHDKYFAPEQ